MHIIVSIKSVVTRAPKGKTVRSAHHCTLNPFDRPVIETALRLKEVHGGTITAVSMGPASARAALSEAMAMGVDRAVLACDPAFAGGDTLATATTLAAVVTYISPFDLLLFGTRTADSDTGQVGPQTAVMLDVPLVAQVRTIEYAVTRLQVEKIMDGYVETCQIRPPAALTILPNSVRPRDVGLAGITCAFEEKDIEVLDITHLDLAAEKTGMAGSPTRVVSMQAIKKKRACELINGEIESQADQLVKHLVDKGLIG